MKTRKRILSGLLCGAMLWGAMAGVPARAAEAAETAPPQSQFTDVAPDAWYAGAVEFCLLRGIMNGMSETEFQPEGTMTRAMMAAVLYRMSGSPAVTGENPFLDVDRESWYGPAVVWAAEQGVVQGYGDGVYAPMDEVTREQLAVFLWRYGGSPQPDGTGPEYADGGSIADWAAEAVDWSMEQGIIAVREEGVFAPAEKALRCELAHALMNYITLSAEKEEPEPAPDPEEEPTPDPEADALWAEFRSILGYQPQAGEVLPNPYDPALFQVNENGYMTYLGQADTSMGIDVSSHQGEIDWQQVAAAGVEFAIIRVGYRGYTMGTINEDVYFKRNVEGALAAGLDVGVYFFSQAITIHEALEEAAFVLDKIRDYPITYPVVFDWERQEKKTSRTKDTSEDTILNCAVAFCDMVEAMGYTPMFYASPSKAYDLKLEYLAKYPFWLAHYTKKMAPTSYKHHFDIWQYTSKGRVPGIDGDVDINLAMRSF